LDIAYPTIVAPYSFALLNTDPRNSVMNLRFTDVGVAESFQWGRCGSGRESLVEVLQRIEMILER